MPKALPQALTKFKPEAIPVTAMAQHEARDAARSFVARRRMVKITRPSKLHARSAGVSFSGVSVPVTPEFAEAMASALMEAAKAARELNIPRRAYMDMDNPEGYYGR